MKRFHNSFIRQTLASVHLVE
uniref:Uncharacterized protein n=1 Tax=Arundo donax TaxID=35708 RepID=A0A0A8ZM31_ARUDO